LKKIFKIIGKTIIGFIAFALLYLFAAFCLSRITINKEPNTAEDVAIYIKTNGVHTDIVVPAKSDQMDWTKQILFSNTTSKTLTINTWQWAGVTKVFICRHQHGQI
jgi:hypothetical protein